MIRNGHARLHGTVKAAVTMTIGGAGSVPAVAIAVTCHGLACGIIAAVAAVLVAAVPTIPRVLALRALRLVLQNPDSASQAAELLQIVLAAQSQGPGH